MSKTYPTCPHDRETFIREQALYSYRCPTCDDRVCLDCRRHGWQDVMISLVDWLTGLCQDCYRERGRRERIRKDYLSGREQRERLAEAWNAGCLAGLAGDIDDHEPNPHDVPTPYERRLLDEHEWLREEVAS